MTMGTMPRIDAPTVAEHHVMRRDAIIEYILGAKRS